MGDGSQANAPVAQVPLFPLNVVLFPQMPLKLHIFEERYKEMINRCLVEGDPFGIVLIREGAADQEKAQTRQVGCRARIAHVERLGDGRMNLLVMGEQRFRIVDTHEGFSYRTGLIVDVADGQADAATVVPLADEVQKLLREFVTQSLAIAGQRVESFDLPDEPEQLSFTTACLLPLDNDEKQALLEERDTAARLAAEKDVLLREVVKLRRAAAAQGPPERVRADHFASYRSTN